MKKLKALIRSERGQSLPIIGLVFLGLLALAGLAIDGGNLFMQRRRAQNAADAASLAGTRLIALTIQTCDPIAMEALDNKIAREINRFAEQNGISDTNGVAGDEVNDNVVGYYVDPDEARLGVVGQTGEVPLSTSGVEVEVKDEHGTFFIMVVGIDKIPSSAQAMAMTGVIHEFPAGGGLLPIAVPQMVVEEMGYGTDWEMHDTGKAVEGEFCYTKPDGSTECIETEAHHQSQRGWLNLNHIFNNEHLTRDDGRNRTFDKSANTAGCNADPPGMQGYASGECPYAHPVIAGTSGNTDGDFIHGSSGAQASAMMEIYDGYAGQIAYAPVFDRVWTYHEMVATFDPQAKAPKGYENTGGGFSTAGGGGDSYYYHIVGYTAVQVGTDKSNKILQGTFQYATIAAGVIPTGYTGGCSPVLHGISLWE
jgi:hypothetical protein